MFEGEFKYRTIFETLKSEILGGRYSSGLRFPSEAQLIRRFGGSRITVIRALQELNRLGLIVRRKGRGSFLTRRAANYGRTLGLIMPISRGEIFPPICREVTRLAQQVSLPHGITCRSGLHRRGRADARIGNLIYQVVRIVRSFDIVLRKRSKRDI